METQTFKNRRISLGERFSRTLFIIPSGTEALRSHSVAYRFKVAGDFLYLTGLDIFSAYLVVIGKNSYLLSDRFQKEDVWDDGGQLTQEDRAQLGDIHYGSFSQLEEIVQSHINDFGRIAFPFGRDEKLDQLLMSFVGYERRQRNRRSNVPLALCDSRTLVGTLRQIKTTEEIALMREAGQRSSLVHRELMQESLAGRTERNVLTWIETRFAQNGMPWAAYDTIVGSGTRSTILHARGTDKIIQSGELVLIDAGGEWQNYCADITRVAPVDKKFTSEQRDVYETVLTAQKNVLQAIRPGVTLPELHELALSSLIEGLAQKGFKQELVRENIKMLMPHSTSHWIGLDVHDPSSYYDDAGNPLRLEQGMCFTVEPGLYFRDKGGDFARYHGIGVRIEDDVVVTAQGAEILTSAPKEIEEVEELRARIKTA